MKYLKTICLFCLFSLLLTNCTKEPIQLLETDYSEAPINGDIFDGNSDSDGDGITDAAKKETEDKAEQNEENDNTSDNK